MIDATGDDAVTLARRVLSNDSRLDGNFSLPRELFEALAGAEHAPAAILPL